MFDGLPLRLRLTLWYTGLVGIILVFFGVMVWGLLSVTLRYQIDQRLLQAAEQVKQYGVDKEGAFDLGHNRQIVRFGNFQGTGLYLQIYDNEKNLVAISSNLQTYSAPLDAISLESALEYETRRDIYLEGQHLRVLTLPFVFKESTYLLQVAASMQFLDSAVLALILILGLGISAALLLSFIAGSLTVERALRPLNQVTQTALTISRADDLSRRIPVTSKEDEIGRLVNAMNQTLERLERLFLSQRRFLSDISHELRTPLTTIRGNVNIIQRLGVADAESLDAIRDETDRLSRLAGDLLTIAQAEGGNLPLVTKVFELDTLLLEVFRDGRVLAAGKVKMELGEEDQIQVLADRDRIRQVVLNLVSNAIKYTPTGGTVTLGWRRIENWVRVTVSDTGRGIPVEDLPFIFDRFYRVEKSRTRNDRTADAGGAGLGLSIAKWLVEAHHGRIEVTSEIGRGSTFHVWLPLQQTSTEAKPIEVPPHLLQTLPAIPAELIRNLRTNLGRKNSTEKSTPRKREKNTDNPNSQETTTSEKS